MTSSWIISHAFPTHFQRQCPTHAVCCAPRSAISVFFGGFFWAHSHWMLIGACDPMLLLLLLLFTRFACSGWLLCADPRQPGAASRGDVDVDCVGAAPAHAPLQPQCRDPYERPVRPPSPLSSPLCLSPTQHTAQHTPPTSTTPNIQNSSAPAHRPHLRGDR